MGILVGQLPPAETARLKAELAETLIAHFCYPRFFDYRDNTLHTRPVDRAKRQEVWLFLSSFDFSSWGRVDIMSAEFQHHVERLFIMFVQRNRTFFGDQGRKRMSDVRQLLGTSSQAIVQGLRNHLSGQRQGNAPFGSPRPAASWLTPSADGHIDLTWEQITQATNTLQQQLLEARGEYRTVPLTPQMEAPPTTPRRPGRKPAPPPPVKAPVVEPAVAPAPAAEKQKTAIGAPANGRSTNPSAEPKSTPAISPATAWSSAPTAPVPAVEVAHVALTSAALPVKPAEQPMVRTPAPDHASQVAPAPIAPTSISRVAVTPNNPRTNAIQPANDEDIAIFEEMRRQMLIWLRVQAIHAGIELTNQGPAQLLDQLRQHDNYDETRLQVVSTLLNLANQVIKTGHATSYDYKQGLMFHLMHNQK